MLLCSFLLVGGQVVFAEEGGQNADSNANATIEEGELVIDPGNPELPEGPGNWGKPNNIAFQPTKLDGKSKTDIPTIDGSINMTISDGRGKGIWQLNVKLNDANFTDNYMTIKLDGNAVTSSEMKVAEVTEWTPSKDVEILPMLDFTEQTNKIGDISTVLSWNLTTDIPEAFEGE